MGRGAENTSMHDHPLRWIKRIYAAHELRTRQFAAVLGEEHFHLARYRMIRSAPHRSSIREARPPSVIGREGTSPGTVASREAQCQGGIAVGRTVVRLGVA